MKRLWFAVAVFTACTMASGAEVPTAREVEDQVMPLLLLNDASDIRMAGFDLTDDLQVSDLEVTDEAAWCAPGFFTLHFRVFFTATEDIYAEVPLSETLWWSELESWAEKEGRELAREGYVLVGKAGQRFSVKYEIRVERVAGKLALADSDSLPRGNMEWPGGFDKARARSCWEAWASALGRKMAFHESVDALQKALRAEAGFP